MSPKRTALACIIITTFLAGCATSRLIKKGDVSMAADRPAPAVEHYEQALGKKPKLQNNKEFMAKLSRARCHAAFQEGQTAAAKEDWDDAVRRFSHSLEIDPKYTKARQALQHARQQASIVHHEKALSYADEGNLRLSTSELKRALELDSNNVDARAASGSLPPDRISPTQSTYEQAQAMQKEKRWLKASELLRSALNQHPNDILCRVELHRTEQTLQHARELRTEGIRLAKDKQLDDAVKTLVQAKEVWPFIDRVQGPLAEAKSLREQSEKYCIEAGDFLDKSAWLKAIGKSKAALDIFPFHQDAMAVLEKAKHEVAQMQCRAGYSFLAKGQPEEAEAAFIEAIKYVPDMGKAKEGIAQIDFARASDAQKRGLWGSALLWYINALQYHQTEEYSRRISAMREKISERISYNLVVEVTESSGAMSPDSTALKSELLRLMSERQPDYLFLGSAQNESDPPDFQALLVISNFDVRSAIVRNDNRTHHYTVYQEVPNPEIPRLNRLLALEARELHRLRREANRPCHRCGGSGKVSCSSCGGKGRHSCRNCKGAGKLTRQACPSCSGTGKRICQNCKRSGKIRCKQCEDTRKKPRTLRRDIRERKRTPRDVKTKPSEPNRPCHRCRGSKRASCPHCRGTGQRTCGDCQGMGKSARQDCPTCSGRGQHICRSCNSSGKTRCAKCKGSGKNTEIDHWDISRQERKVRNLKRKLRGMPSTITRGFPTEWPYVVNHHEKRGIVEASIQIIKPTTGVVASDAVRKDALHRDSTVQNPNPDIGLRPDRLSLPSDTTVRRSLIHQAASEACAKVLDTVTQNRIAEAQANVDRLKGEGRNVEALEAEVDLASLLAPLDPARAADIIDKLRERISVAGPKQVAAVTMVSD